MQGASSWPALSHTFLTCNRQFYLDDLEDDLTITALRMLVKDLLILFQAGNEGVINVLGLCYIVLYDRNLHRGRTLL